MPEATGRTNLPDLMDGGESLSTPIPASFDEIADNLAVSEERRDCILLDILFSSGEASDASSPSAVVIRISILKRVSSIGISDI